MWPVVQLSPPLQPYGLYPTRFLCPWDSPGKNTGVGCHFLFLQGIFLTQKSNPCLWSLLHWQADSLPLSYLGSHGKNKGNYSINVRPGVTFGRDEGDVIGERHIGCLKDSANVLKRIMSFIKLIFFKLCLLCIGLPR